MFLCDKYNFEASIGALEFILQKCTQLLNQIVKALREVILKKKQLPSGHCRKGAYIWLGGIGGPGKFGNCLDFNWFLLWKASLIRIVNLVHT